MSDPKVSIILPYLNGSEYLEDITKSLQEQIFQDFEVILVLDKRSIDDYDMISESFDGFSDARIIVNEERGLGSARNLGIAESRGEYIWFLDMDDYAYPDFLSSLVTILGDNDADIVFCNNYHTFGKDIPQIPDEKYTIKCEDSESAIRHINDYPVYSWSRIQRKSVFDDERALFDNTPALEDYGQTVREVSCCSKVCYYDKPLYLYRKSKISATMINRSREIESMEQIAELNMQLIEDMYPSCVEDYRKGLIEKMIRQRAFSKYGIFRKGYRQSLAHRLIKDSDKRTIEMKVFRFSGLLYFLILFPFTRFKWDRKEGYWKEPDFSKK